MTPFNRIALAIGWIMIASATTVLAGAFAVLVYMFLGLSDEWGRELMSWTMAATLSGFIMCGVARIISYL